MNSYYEIWNNSRREPRVPLSATEAHQRLSKGERLCVVIEERGCPLRTVIFGPNNQVVAATLRDDRQEERAIMYERHGEQLFLSQTADFEYDTAGTYLSTTWTVYSKTGAVRTETIRRGNSTSLIEESKEDPASRWSTFPTLENLSVLFAPIPIKRQSPGKAAMDAKSD